MKKLIILIVLILSFKGLNAQNQDYIENFTAAYYKAVPFIYSNKDSAYHYLKKIEKLTIENDDWSSNIDILSAWNKSSAYFSDLKQLKKNLTKLDSIFITHEETIDTLTKKRSLQNALNFDKGIYSYSLRDFNTAKSEFRSIIKSLEAISDSLNINDINLLRESYSFLAKINTIDTKYDLAKLYYKKNIRFIKDKTPDNKKKIYRNNSLLAEVYEKEGKHETSKNLFIESLNYNINNGGNSNSILSEAFHISENYIKLKQLDSAKYYLNIAKKQLSPKHVMLQYYYVALSDFHKANNDFELAKSNLDKALTIEKGNWENTKNLDVATLYNKTGDMHSSFNQNIKALQYYNLAEVELTDLETKSDASAIELLKVLKKKAQLLNEDNNNKVETTIKKAIALLDDLKPKFKTETDKQLLIENAFPVFETGIEAYYKSFIKTKNQSLIDQSFYLAEKSKSTLLIEALLSAKATKFANIPEAILDNENELVIEINYIEKQIAESKENSNNLQDTLFVLKQQYNSLIEEIETNYKAYYNLKYNTKVRSVENIQKTLKEDDILISYFYGNKAIYAIAISKNSKQFISKPINEAFKADILEFQKAISNPKSNIDSLSQQSFAIYSQILLPLIKDSQTKNLIIIPDGLLNYIPFSSLNTSKNNTKYLIEDHAVSYINSATLLSQLQEEQENNSEILAFAPTFEAGDNELLPLPNNKKEVKTILTHVKGKSFLDNDASLQNFNKSSDNYNIIHLATHAIFDDANPEYSFLAFAPKAETENLLYIKDLYNLKLNANLVTLSACESGIGDLKRGEGLMSLARGFYFSGAKSIASTLWKINDASSSKLMDDFYLQLSKNDNKNIALQKAQVNFINNNRENALSHPYYWSGFVISGNTNALNSSSDHWLLLLSILLIIVGLYFIYFNTKKVN